MFRSICVITFLILFQTASILEERLLQHHQFIRPCVQMLKPFLFLIRGRKKQKKEMWKALANYRVWCNSPHKRLPSLLMPITSAQDPQSPFRSDNFLEEVNNSLKNFYTHDYSLSMLKSGKGKKHTGQSWEYKHAASDVFCEAVLFSH